MQPNLSLSGLNMSDLSILYVLIAVIILLALIAAIGAWARGGGIRREDAESLFSEAQERHRTEIARLEELLQETRKATEAAQQAARDAQDRSEATLVGRLQEVDQQVQRTRTGLEASVSQASADYSEALSDELEMVTRKLGETDRRVNSGFSDLNEALGRVQFQVSQAGDQIRQALIEITRQQQEQKAQSTVQLCEALISSLGTLKSSIVNQLEQNSGTTVDAERPVQQYSGVEQTAVGEVRTASHATMKTAAASEDGGSDEQADAPVPLADAGFTFAPESDNAQVEPASEAFLEASESVDRVSASDEPIAVANAELSEAEEQPNENGEAPEDEASSDEPENWQNRFTT